MMKYIYTYTCIYIYAHTYTHTHTYIDTYIYIIYTYIHVYIHTHLPKHTYNTYTNITGPCSINYQKSLSVNHILLTINNPFITVQLYVK